MNKTAKVLLARIILKQNYLLEQLDKDGLYFEQLQALHTLIQLLEQELDD